MSLDKFAVFILTHGRPDRVITWKTLEKCGYTGKVFLIVDNLDKTANDYIKEYGDLVHIFDKNEMASRVDKGDNFNNLVTITHARNACWDIARKLNIEYFIQLDDDYTDFRWRFDSRYNYNPSRLYSLDRVLEILLKFYIDSGFLTLAISQGGDFVGGENAGLAKKIKLKRKAMNSFICSIHRPFQFVGTLNEDVNTYTSLATRGNIFATLNYLCLEQLRTQSNPGGITDTYLKFGTYAKAFTSIIYHPSGVKIRPLRDRGSSRIHHVVNYKRTAPRILRENLKKIAT